ncbi:MAG: glycosyltransferase family 2 protein [Pseudomonadota bacterium]
MGIIYVFQGAEDHRALPPGAYCQALHADRLSEALQAMTHYRIAVVTPYFKESTDILRQCHESVAGQSYAVDHFMVADGYPKHAVARWPVEHFVLPEAHADNGNTPRAIASLSAIARQYDAVTYLDADNWYRPEHIATLVKVRDETGAAICISGRSIHHLNGSVLFPKGERDDGRAHADTSCMMFWREAFKLIPLWNLMPPQWGPICDKIMWFAIGQSGLQRSFTAKPTVCFRSQYQLHYEHAGVPVPKGAIKPPGMNDAIDYWNTLSDKERRYYRERMNLDIDFKMTTPPKP